MSDIDRIVISGASGAIGSVIVRDLMRRYPYAQVVCVMRSERSLDRLHQVLEAYQVHRIVPLYLDLAVTTTEDERVSSLGKADRCLAVHCAGDVSWTKADRLMTPINVHGTARFAELVLSLSRTKPSLIFLSTAFIDEGRTLRNAYERTKLEAERLLKERYLSRINLAIARCSLVVGSSVDGSISRFNGLYPLVRLVALAEVPCVVAEAKYHVDTIPIDYVSRQVSMSAQMLSQGQSLIEIVAASGGEHSIAISELVARIVASATEFRARAGLGPVPPISVINNRQFQFLLRAAKSWDMAQRFDQIERISSVMAGYVTHGETGRSISPTWLDRRAPAPRDYIDKVIRYWLQQHADKVTTDRPRVWQTGSIV